MEINSEVNKITDLEWEIGMAAESQTTLFCSPMHLASELESSSAVMRGDDPPVPNFDSVDMCTVVAPALFQFAHSAYPDLIYNGQQS